MQVFRQWISLANVHFQKVLVYFDVGTKDETKK